MAELSDETLMAFADDALDKDEHARVAAIIADRPDLAAKVRRFEQTGRPIRQVFEAAVEGPVPQALVDHVRNSPIEPRADVTDLAAARAARDRKITPDANRSGRRLSWPAAAIAASVCLALGAGAGWIMKARSGGDPLASVVQLALETVPAGSEIAVAGRPPAILRVRPTLSFQDKDHQFCRQYEIIGDSAGRTEGVACRGQTGGWKVLVEAVRPAAGMTPAAGSADSVGAVRERLSAGDYLSKDEEARALASRWRVSAPQ